MTFSATRRGFAVVAVVGLVALALSSVRTPAADASSKGSDGSGGRAVGHYAGGKVIRSSSVTSKAPDARLFRIGLNSTEPTLGATQDGQIFTSAFQSNTRIEVVRTKNDGKSWDVVSPKLPGGRNAQLLSLDPYTYVDNPKSDRDFSRVFTIDLTVACAYLSFTDNNGKSWTTNPLLCGRPVNDHQTLFGGPPVVSPTVGYPHILYYCWNDVATSSCQKSLDGGITWTATGSPAFPGVDPAAEEEGFGGVSGFCGGLHGHGFVDDNGTVYIPKGHCGQPWLSMSKDEGRTWERVQVAKNGAPEHEASVAADSAGNIYYTYVAQDRLPYLVVSKDKGKTWSKPMMIGAPGLTEANLPSLALGAKGKIAIAYMGTTNGPTGPPQDREEDQYAKTTWNGYMTTTADALSKTPVFYSASVNDPKDPFIRGSCGPGRCKAVYDFIDVIIDRNGRAWSAWVDGCIAVCVTTGPSNLGSDGVIGRFDGGIRLN